MKEVLTLVLKMREARDFASSDGAGGVHVFEMGDGGAAAELRGAVEPVQFVARKGAGAVHHVVFRTPDIEASRAWLCRLNEFRIPNSGKVERRYFQSLYSREPGGNLFQIVTDGPGFAVDEPMEALGKSLAPPPFLEDLRRQNEAGLKPLG